VKRTQEFAYFDTSILIKNYIKETGSRRARGLLRRYRFISSVIAPVEIFSALYRRESAEELEEKDLSAILTRIREDRLYWKLVEVSSLVLSRSEELVQWTGLRTLDALHLASLITIKDALGIHIPFITGDRRQRDAAKQLQLDTIWVE
jgi:predicted nucleic acid-binding protein